MTYLEDLQAEYSINQDDVQAAIDNINLEVDGWIEDGATEDDEDVVLLRKEVATLEAFNEEMSGYGGDWNYGDSAINEANFKEYAQEMAEDIGAINGKIGWPHSCIDWDQAVRELKMDYCGVELGDTTFYIR